MTCTNNVYRFSILMCAGLGMEHSLETEVCSEKSTKSIVEVLNRHSLLGLLGLLGQEHGLDVGQYTALGNGHAGQEFVQFLVVADGQLQMAGDDPGLLVVASGVSCQLEHLGGEVLHDGGQVDGGTGADALAIVALAEQTVDAADGELQTGAARAALALALRLASFTTSRHVDREGVRDVLSVRIHPRMR